METTCQASYPLNSENASPPGTFKVYLSCADTAQPPTTANTPVIIAIVSTLLRLIVSTSLMVKCSATPLQTQARSCAIGRRPLGEVLVLGPSELMRGGMVPFHNSPRVPSGGGARNTP